MICPYCGYDDQIVINKRETDKNTRNWRRRRCTKCFRIFTTYEGVDLNFIIVIKQNGKRVRYKREKMYAGIYHAFYRIKSSDSGNAASIADSITNKIENKLMLAQTKEITTEELRYLIASCILQENFNAGLNYISYFFKPKSFFDLTRYEKKIKKIREMYSQ